MELLSSSYKKKRNREFGIQEMGESFLKLTTESPTTDINMSKRVGFSNNKTRSPKHKGTQN